jgi:hypothetical protein
LRIHPTAKTRLFYSLGITVIAVSSTCFLLVDNNIKIKD